MEIFEKYVIKGNNNQKLFGEAYVSSKSRNVILNGDIILMPVGRPEHEDEEEESRRVCVASGDSSESSDHSKEQEPSDEEESEFYPDVDKDVLMLSSLSEKRLISRKKALSIIKKAGMKSRDLKLISDCLERDEKYQQRQIVTPRSTSNSVIFFLEHLKVSVPRRCVFSVVIKLWCFQLICFNSFCLILFPDGDLTKKFIDQECKSLQRNNDNQSFAANILEGAVESIISKFRKRIRLIKPPLDKLMMQVETKPTTSALKKLFAVKKGVNQFQLDVDNVSKKLKEFREDTAVLTKMKLNIQGEEWEEALDFLISDIEDIAENVNMIIETIEETDQFVNSHQDNVRNELMKMNLSISILALTLGFGAFIGGIFGMNVTNSLETDPHAFMIIVLVLAVVMVAICAAFTIKYVMMKRDTSDAQSFSVLKNFFKCVDDLEFQDFPKLLKKSDFAEAVKRMTKMNVNEKEVDFLFQMVDNNGDGVIDTETELAVRVGITPLRRKSRRDQQQSRDCNTRHLEV